MTVLELLDQIPNTTIYAGHKGLNKCIRTISLIDAPSAVDWLKGGEVIITSAFLYKDDDGKQTEFIRTLILVGCCALGIKFGRYIDKLPPEAIELAEKSDFPIFGIGINTVWSEVLAPFYSHQYAERNPPSSPVRFFSFQKLGSLSSKGNLDSQFCGCFTVPAVIIDENYDIQGYNAQYGRAIYDEYCSLCREYSKGINLQHLFLDGRRYQVISVTLNSMHTIHLFLDGSIGQVYYPHDFDWISSLYKTSVEKNSTALKRSELWYFFLKEYVVDSTKPIDGFPQVTDAIGGDGAIYAVIIFSSSAAAEEFKQTQFIPLSRKTAFFEYSRIYGEYVSVYSRLDTQDPSVFSMQAERLLCGISAAGRIYLGKPVSTLDKLQASYQTAKSAQTMGNLLRPQQSFISYSSFELIDILMQNGYGYGEISNLQKSIRSFDPIETLEKYLAFPNIKQAAEALYIQPNSMRYRIKQIEQVIPVDLSSAMARADLLIKITMYKVAAAKSNNGQ